MFNFTSTQALIRKDFRLFFLQGGGLSQALLLGLLLIFLFSLSQSMGEKIQAQGAATLFWLASLFCMILIFNNLYSLDEENNVKTGLHLQSSHILTIWFAKALCGFLFILLAQCVFLPCMVIFLDITPSSNWFLPFGSILCIDVGMAGCGALLGSLSVGQTGKESLLSIILFPLLTPLLLAGINILTLFFDSGAKVTAEAYTWLGIILAFDGLFLGASLLLFPFMYRSDY